jgi:hypothetical protein
MRSGNKHITAAFVAGATALTIAVAPPAVADSQPAPTVVAATASATSPHIVQVRRGGFGYGGHGGHGGGFYGGGRGFHGGYGYYRRPFLPWWHW